MFRSFRLAPLTAVAVLALGLTTLVPLAAAADDGLTDGWTATTPFCATLAGSPQMVCAGDADTLDAAVDDVVLPQAVVLIARLYDNSNYDTAAGYLDVYGNACTSTKTDIDASQSSLGSYNNRVSSFQSYSGCATKLYTAGSFGGTSYPTSGYLTSTTYVGATMNDNAESARFS